MLKKNSGVSLITLIITIIVVIILAVIVMIGTGGTIEQANYSSYMDDLGKVKEAVQTKAMEVKGEYLIEGRTVSMEEIYHYVAKGGKTGEDFVGKANVPAYTIIDRAKADIGIEIPTRNIESGTARNVQIQYIVTKEGEVFAWPPYEYEDKLYITENVIVAGKLDKNVQIEDESFTLDLDATLGTVVPEGEGTLGGDTPGGENPGGNNPGGETPEGNFVYDDTFPIEISSTEILNSDNPTVEFEGDTFCKISNLTPDTETMIASTLSATVYYDSEGVNTFSTFAADDSTSETVELSLMNVVGADEIGVDFDCEGYVYGNENMFYPLFVLREEVIFNETTYTPGIFAMVVEGMEIHATLTVRETKYDDTFPIQFNSTEIANSGNYRQTDGEMIYYKVSNLTPDDASMMTSTISVSATIDMDGDGVIDNIEIVDAPVVASQSQGSATVYLYGTTYYGEELSYPLYVVYDEMTVDGIIVFAGIYAMIPEGVNMSATIKSDYTAPEEMFDNKAYALVLDNSSDANNALPMIFVRAEEAPVVGDTYVSKTYGSLPILEVYTDFENKRFYITDFENFCFPGWQTSNYQTTITSVVTEDEIAPISTAWWFQSCGAIKNIDLQKLNTSNLVDMYNMFGFCDEVETIILGDTWTNKKVTNMGSLFEGCNALETLILGNNWNTEKVTDMSNMFSGCEKLSSIDLSNFNTQNVTDMEDMFRHCYALTSIDITGFNTQKVTDMSGMFECCPFKSITFGTGWNTQNVKDMSIMFRWCEELESLTFGDGWNTQNVEDMSNMFFVCRKLNKITFGENWSTANVTSMSAMFNECNSITSLDLSKFNTQNVTDMYCMFDGCELLESIIFGSGWNTQNVTNMHSMFGSCSKLNLNCQGWNVDKVTSHNFFNGFAEGVIEPIWVN